jgi:hypothetical protein
MLFEPVVMSERQWRVLSLLERLNRGEVTVGEVAALPAAAWVGLLTATRDDDRSTRRRREFVSKC